MSVFRDVQCDDCKKRRLSDSNNWHTIEFDDTEFRIKKGIFDEQDHHCCGSSCASHLFARWLSTGKLDAE